MFRDFNFDAIFKDPETHPEARNLRQFHEDIEQALVDIRLKFPDADNDPGFKQAANALEIAIPLGKVMESKEPIESGKLEAKRAKAMLNIGHDGVVNVTGEPSKMLAEKFIELFQAMLDKKYWPDSKCRKDLFGVSCFSFLNQSYISAYDKDFRHYLPKMFNEKMAKLDFKIETYNKENNITLRN